MNSGGESKRDPPVQPANRAALRAADIDTAALDRWMRAHVAGYEGPLNLERFSGGQSNPTYRLAARNRVYVLRRKPAGELLPGAHAVEREARVLIALAETGFPVPRVHALCTDDRVIGTHFYIMDVVEGRIFWDPKLPEVPRESRALYFDAMNETLARLHKIDVVAAQLEDFGRSGQYLQRQISRWSKQYLANSDAGRDTHMDLLLEWLPRHIPAEDETCLVHGDFRCDNMVFHAVEPRVIGVLDWELSTLGHPLADFAYHLMMYRMPPTIRAGLAGADLHALGIPSEADYVAAYCRRSGRRGIPDHDLQFYLAYNLFRFAAIVHGIKGRILRGNAAGADAAHLVEALPAIATLGWDLATV